MNQSFLETMDLFFLEAAGKSSKGINPDNLKEILEISKSQGVYYYVLAALKRLSDEGRLLLSETDINTIKTTLFKVSTNNTNKLILFSEILKKLENSGIKCCILKGESLSRFYSSSALRTSGDIDVLISPDDEEKAIDILRENGFDVKERMWGCPHDVCYHEDIGRIELHIDLYNDYANEVWFKSEDCSLEEEYLKTYSENGYSYFTLGVTDGFIHTFLHGIKHFLTDGIGLRHISDILLYLKNQKNLIDFERVYGILDKLKYRNFFNTIIGIGILYCGFNKDRLPVAEYDEKLCIKLLEEICTFGMFGNQQNGAGFNKRYTELRCNAQNKNGGSKYLRNKKVKNIMEYASLSKKNMNKRYYGQSVLSARVKHINKLLSMLADKLLNKKETDIYKSREQLVRDLDMI